MNDGIHLLPQSASTFAGESNALFYTLIAFAFALGSFLTFLVVRYAIIYRRGSPAPRTGRRSRNLWLEIGWTGASMLIAFGIFAWSADLFIEREETPPNALHVIGVGKQWMWKFEHPGGQREINELHVPVDAPVVVELGSQDVIHSFFIPAFRVKQDAVPGMSTSVWFEATKPGEYNLFCAEFCGTEHSKMRGLIVAMKPADYSAWLDSQPEGDDLVAQGGNLFRALGCSGCHEGNGTVRAPDLHGVFGRPGRARRRHDGHRRHAIHPRFHPDAEEADRGRLRAGHAELRRSRRRGRADAARRLYPLAFAGRSAFMTDAALSRGDYLSARRLVNRRVARDDRPQARRLALSLHPSRLLLPRRPDGDADPTRARDACRRPRLRRDLQPHLHAAWHRHGVVLSGAVDPGDARQFPAPADDRRARPRLPAAQSRKLVRVRARQPVHALRRPDGRRRYRLDVLHAAVEHVRQRLGKHGGGRSLHRRLLVDHDRHQLHRDGPQAARAGSDLVPPADLRVDALRDEPDHGAGDAGARRSAAPAHPRPARRHRHLRSVARRRSAALPAPLLVLLAPGRLHHDPAGHGRRLGDHPLLRPAAAVRLHGGGARHDGDRGLRLPCLGPPHVRLRPVRLCRHRSSRSSASASPFPRPSRSSTGR